MIENSQTTLVDENTDPVLASMSVLGIDISKKTLHLCLRVRDMLNPGGEVHWCPPMHRQVTNDATGFRSLTRWLNSNGVARVAVVMEATGPYWHRAAMYLHAKGHRVSVENPTRVTYFARSDLRRQKTDPHDAALLAEFAIHRVTREWTPLPEATQRLRDLSRCLDQLDKETRRYKNMLESATEMRQDASVLTTWKRMVTQIEKEVQRINACIAEVIASCPRLREDMALLCSIPGIGEKTARLILAELPPFERFSSARQVAAYVGVTPVHYASGTSVKRRSRISKTGAARLRKGLFYPALVARRANPLVADLGDRLAERGKAGMQIVIAGERKLLHIVYGVLKHRQPFDPNHGRAA